MKKKIATIPEADVSSYDSLVHVTNLANKQDIATFVETYFEAIKTVSYKHLSGVVEDREGYYYFLEAGYESDFDLITFINTHSDVEGTCLSCLNIKNLISPLDSRGVYTEIIRDENDPDGDEDGEDYEDESATSFLEDEEDDSADAYEEDADDEGTILLMHLNTSNRIPIDKDGIKFGRSAKQSDYVIHGNSNIGRLHCLVYKSGNSLMVHDYNSLNGTFINGKRVDPLRDGQLHHGDSLSMSNEHFEVL